jgi:hypothetical protein
MDRANKYKVYWICREQEQEQVTEITALEPKYAARTVIDLMEVVENRTDVQVTSVKLV